MLCGPLIRVPCAWACTISAAARWKTGAKVLEATIGHGLPFAYFKITGGNAVITQGGSLWYNRNGTLFALFRHQWPEAAVPLTGYSYPGARGEMKVAEGPSFSTAMVLNGILPAMPDLGNDPAKLKSLVAEFAGDTAKRAAPPRSNKKQAP